MPSQRSATTNALDRPQWLDEGRNVLTPSGATARVLYVYLSAGRWEAAVEWGNGERGAFRAVHLKPGK